MITMTLQVGNSVREIKLCPNIQGVDFELTEKNLVDNKELRAHILNLLCKSYSNKLDKSKTQVNLSFTEV
jgi:hypothetical protein